MSIKNWNAGIIRPVAVPPAGPYQDGAASGVWTLDQVSYWQKQGLWPVAGKTAPIGLFGGGNGPVNVIDWIEITTLGNATDFGDLTSSRTFISACSSSTRGVFGAIRGSNIIDFVTFASAGNAVDFGDMANARNRYGACSNNTRGLFAGGED